MTWTTRSPLAPFLITASAVAASAGLATSCTHSTTAARHASTDAHRANPTPTNDWSPVDTHPEKTSQLIARRCVKQLADQGVPPEHLAQLETDFATIVRALMIPDFDAYHRLMTAKGAELDSIAEEYVAQLGEWGLYPSAIPELASSRSIVDRVRHIWNMPSPRRLRWLAVNTESQAAGTGLIVVPNSEAWPFTGSYSQLSLYAPASGRLTRSNGTRLNKSKESVWICLDIRCEGGLETKLRINFYFDRLSNTWYPVTTLIGNNWSVRGLPIL